MRTHHKKYVICPRFIKSMEKFCVTNSLNIKVVRKTKKLHIYKCVGLISKFHAFKCVIFVVKKVQNLNFKAWTFVTLELFFKFSMLKNVKI